MGICEFAGETATCAGILTVRARSVWVGCDWELWVGRGKRADGSRDSGV